MKQPTELKTFFDKENKMTNAYQTIIENAWEHRADITPSNAPDDVRKVVKLVLEHLKMSELLFSSTLNVRMRQRSSSSFWERARYK